MTKKLWVALIATFLIGIFALAVQPTAANISQVDQQVAIQSMSLNPQTMFVFDRWTGLLAGAGVALITLLFYLVISRRKKLKAKL